MGEESSSSQSNQTNKSTSSTSTSLLRSEASLAFDKWFSESQKILCHFLEQVRDRIIENENFDLPRRKILISYALSEDEAERCRLQRGIDALTECFNILGLPVTLSEVSDAQTLKAKCNDHEVLIVLCTPAYVHYAQKDEKAIAQVIEKFGAAQRESLIPLLCAPWKDGVGVKEVALKIVEDYYLIRPYESVLKPQSADSLSTFKDVILNAGFGGQNRLGALPVILGLKDKGHTEACQAYHKLFDGFSFALQWQTIQYRLQRDVIQQLVEMPLSHYELDSDEMDFIKLVYDQIDSQVSELQQLPQRKTQVFLCASPADSLLTGRKLVEFCQRAGQIVILIDCLKFREQGTAITQLIECYLEKLDFKQLDKNRLKKSETDITLVFLHYDALKTYQNLYVKNCLRNWQRVKTVYTCLTEFFQNRDPRLCFIDDPTRLKFETIEVTKLNAFVHQRGKVAEYTAEYKSRTDEPVKQEGNQDDLVAHQGGDFFSAKWGAMQSILTDFLTLLHKRLVSDGYLNPVIEENSQGFISYAWEYQNLAGEKTPEVLANQQRHLSNMVRDLGRLGFPVWLDIERMTGHIDQQVGGSIDDSHFALVIGTPRYLARVLASEEVPNSVQKEFRRIVKRESEKALAVFPLRFPPEGNLPDEVDAHPNTVDFQQIDMKPDYLRQLTTLLEGIIRWRHDINLVNKYWDTYLKLDSALRLLPATYLITDRNQDLVQTYDIASRLMLYVCTRGLRRPEQNIKNGFYLSDAFEEFLKNEQKTLVIFGKAGSGKSLFALYQFHDLLKKWHVWRHQFEGQGLLSDDETLPKWLPIYIPLRDYPGERADKAIELALGENYRLDEEAIKELKAGLRISQRVLFILDGYDELGKEFKPNYSRWLSDWPFAKVLISSRPEHFENDAEHRLAFSLNDGRLDFTVVYVSPFSDDDIDEYISKYALSQTGQFADEIRKEINTISGLMELVNNPFLLSLVVQGLPRLTKRWDDSQIRRVDIYEAFVGYSVEKEAQKYQDVHGQSVDMPKCREFAEKIAFGLYKADQLILTSELEELWIEFSNPENSLIRQACPLKRVESGYSFIHKSVYEYLVAVYLWRMLEGDQVVLSDMVAAAWGVHDLEDTGVALFLMDLYRSQKTESMNTVNKSDEVTDKLVCQTKPCLFSKVTYEGSCSNVAISLSNLGIVCRNLGLYQEARDYHERSLAIRKEIDGASHTNVAISLNKLGGVYRNLGLYQEAKSCYEEALDIFRMADQEGSNRNVARSLNNLGGVYWNLGLYQEAKDLHKEALEIFKTKGELNSDVATSLNNLGSVCWSLKLYEEAKGHHKLALPIFEIVYGESHPEVATSLDNLGLVYQALGRYQKGKIYCEQALAIRKAVYGESHPRVAISLNNLALICWFLRLYQEAKSYYEKALAIKEITYEKFDPDIARGLSNLGGVCCTLELYQEAKGHFKRALEIRKAIDAKYHSKESRSNLVKSLNDLGGVCRALALYQEAKDYYGQTLTDFADSETPNFIAECSLGMFNAYGLDCERSIEKALEYYRKAVNSIYPPAQVLLGVHYAMGLGVDINAKEAETLFRTVSCEQQRYNDYSELVKLFKMLAKSGEQSAQLLLAVMYERGLLNVDADTSNAIAYYRQAADLGCQYASDKCHLLSSVDQSLVTMPVAETGVPSSSSTLSFSDSSNNSTGSTSQLSESIVVPLNLNTTSIVSQTTQNTNDSIIFSSSSPTLFSDSMRSELPSSINASISLMSSTTSSTTVPAVAEVSEEVENIVVLNGDDNTETLKTQTDMGMLN